MLLVLEASYEGSGGRKGLRVNFTNWLSLSALGQNPPEPVMNRTQLNGYCTYDSVGPNRTSGTLSQRSLILVRVYDHLFCFSKKWHLVQKISYLHQFLAQIWYTFSIRPTLLLPEVLMDLT